MCLFDASAKFSLNFPWLAPANEISVWGVNGHSDRMMYVHVRTYSAIRYCVVYFQLNSGANKSSHP